MSTAVWPPVSAEYLQLEEKKALVSETFLWSLQSGQSYLLPRPASLTGSWNQFKILCNHSKPASRNAGLSLLQQRMGLPSCSRHYDPKL